MRTSPAQFNMLVRFMEVNGDLSVTHGMAWRKMKQWEKLAYLLNKDSTYGDPKSSNKWRKVWSDLKNNTKKKLVRLTNAKKTGQDTNIKILSALEKRVLRVMADTKTLLRVMKDIDKNVITTELIQKRWAVIRSQRKQTAGSIEAETTEIEKVDLGTSSQEMSLSSDPFVSVKDEESWEFSDGSDEENSDKELEAAEVPQGMTSPVAESTSSIMGLANEINDMPPSQESMQDLQRQDREKELHKLQVAERVWVLKTLRERHATARLEREKAQLEREKTQFEREKAQFERDKAQYERDAAQILRDKAQFELNRTLQENETSTFYNK